MPWLSRLDPILRISFTFKAAAQWALVFLPFSPHFSPKPICWFKKSETVHKALPYSKWHCSHPLHKQQIGFHWKCTFSLLFTVTLACYCISIITPPVDAHSAPVHRVRCHLVAEWSYSSHSPKRVFTFLPLTPNHQLQLFPWYHVDLLSTCWAEPPHSADSQCSLPLLWWARSACQVSQEANLVQRRRWEHTAGGRGLEDQEWVSPGQHAIPLAERSQGPSPSLVIRPF